MKRKLFLLIALIINVNAEAQKVSLLPTASAVNTTTSFVGTQDSSGFAVTKKYPFRLVTNTPSSVSYGDSTHMLKITFDANGRISGVTTYTFNSQGTLNSVLTGSPNTNRKINMGKKTGLFPYGSVQIGLNTVDSSGLVYFYDTSGIGLIQFSFLGTGKPFLYLLGNAGATEITDSSIFMEKDGGAQIITIDENGVPIHNMSSPTHNLTMNPNSGIALDAGVALNLGAAGIVSGTGNPTGTVGSSKGSIKIRTDGSSGNLLYVNNNSSTGWDLVMSGYQKGNYDTLGVGGQTVYHIVHGMGGTPSAAFLTSKSTGSAAPYKLSYNSTDIVITFSTAPGGVDLDFDWLAIK